MQYHHSEKGTLGSETISAVNRGFGSSSGKAYSISVGYLGQVQVRLTPLAWEPDYYISGMLLRHVQ